MKIGIDARLWDETGVGRYIRNLVKHLQIIDRENDYVLFVRNDFSANGAWPAKGEARQRRQMAPGKWRVVQADIRWHSFQEQWEMPKILEKERLDLVHFPYFNVPIFYRGPFVVTIHDLIINHFSTGRATTLLWPLYGLKRFGYKTALNHAIKNSQKIIAVSESTKGEIVDHFRVNPGKIVVTYESGELKVSNGAMKQWNNKIPIKKPYLLYVGNAHPHKNLERLLEAFKKLKMKNEKFKTTNKNLKIIFVGKEDFFYMRLKKRMEARDLCEEVVFYDEASDAELYHLYKNATALILPSLMEGFGLPALEAMGQGCLVLASDIPAHREICADAAAYFDPLNIEEMAAKMESAYFSYSKDWDEMVKRGLLRAKMFSWEKMTKETLRIYEEVK